MSTHYHVTTVRFGTERTAELFARAARRRGLDASRDGNEVTLLVPRGRVEEVIREWALNRGRLPSYTVMDWGEGDPPRFNWGPWGKAVSMARDFAARIAELRGRAAGGVVDMDAVRKFWNEHGELMDDLGQGDVVGALTEVADVVYYAAKAVIAGLWINAQAKEEVEKALDRASQYGLRLTLADAVAMMRAKYTQRIENARLGIPKKPEGDRLERAAVAEEARRRDILVGKEV